MLPGLALEKDKIEKLLVRVKVSTSLKKGQANIWRNDNIMNEYCLQKEVPRNYRTCIPPL